ncbi:flagellar filament capping protein FliD [Candidatus Nitronereus thalassa]|uniref:Flagellar hook-associated protein 2 n=1 Tax=Candidatus Nitronereus thalassa TaxID=3020898 RepID=A0ABU3K614_9BACT|nr:flagellar filament capping protein FliD [Candidatus Nitronereus thalassa]MDT7041835.1 flagellar filament capping protein FliD [Candidatus Nitronereus thalassa]
MGLTSATGLISGINFNEVVSQLVELESQPILLLQSRKASLETVSAELSTLSVKLSGLQSAASKLSSLANFNVNSVSVTKSTSGIELLSATVNSSAVPGTSQVQVNQLAQAHSIASQGFVDDDTTAIASASGTFKFKVGNAGAETSISITNETTLVQLRDAINNANGSVQASILNDGSGSNPYRLVLASKNTGTANSVNITSNPTTLDFTNKQVEDAYANATNSYSGTVASNSGNNYLGTTNKTFLVEIVTGGDPGTATYKYSIDGGITFLGANGAAYNGSNAITTQTSLTNYIDGQGSSSTTEGENEGVQISFGASSGTLVAGDEFTIDVFNPTLQEAKDAVIEVGNLTISKSSNTISDVIQGVTLNLLQADSASTIDVTVVNDTSGIQSQIEGFISAYNDVIEYLQEQLSFDPEDPESNTAKPLLGDTTAVLLNRQLQNLITSAVPGASSSLNSLAKLGISTNEDTSKISLDSATFSAAIAANITNVTRLFVGIGVPSNSQIKFVSKTDETDSGSYGLFINTAPTRATIDADHAIQAGGITAQEVISVSFFSDATNSAISPTTAQITAAAGSTINDIVNALNSAFATQKIAASASNNSGAIRIRATEYGDDIKIQVHSDQDNSATQSGLGTADSTAKENTGVDIAGTINGFKANGKGAVLTSGSGFADDGLSIRAEVTTTGNFGTITVSSGVADRIASLIRRNIDTSTGTIRVRQDGIADSVESIDEEIERKGVLVAAFEERTRQQFQRLEVLLGQFQIQGNALTAGLTSIQNLQAQINNR